jgi:hypothetical protein
MASIFRKRSDNPAKRALIKEGEGKLTYVQIFGFILIILGIIYFASFLLPSGVIKIFSFLELEEHPDHNEVPIAFFTVMLGLSFAFPDMLKGQTKDISTMRIIVFMFANVICMLLLKMGWGKDSLSAIGLDGYWMGVIAFLFGAKATQSYFEKTRSFLPNTGSNVQDEEQLKLSNLSSFDHQESASISKIAIAQLAKVQNEAKLLAKFSNIESVSETIKNGDSCLRLYIKDDNTESLPEIVDVLLNERKIVKVKTEIVPNVGDGIPHYGQDSVNIVDSNSPTYYGSVCCAVRSELYPSFKGVLTSGHIFTKGKYINYDGYVTTNNSRNALSNNNPIGKLYYQEINPTQDLAIVELFENSNFSDNFLQFHDHHECTIDDIISQEPVTVLSRNGNKRDAYIIDFNITRQIYYGINHKFVTNIILIGSSPDIEQSKTVSEGGDSGSCVYHKSGKIVGMLLGGDKKFSFVLPFKETLQSNNFKII